jgi:hypothetical protein
VLSAIPPCPPADLLGSFSLLGIILPLDEASWVGCAIAAHEELHIAALPQNGPYAPLKLHKIQILIAAIVFCLQKMTLLSGAGASGVVK